MTGEQEVLSVPVLFLQTAFGANAEVLEVISSREELWHWLLERWELALEYIGWCRDLQGALGENIPLLGVRLEEGILPSQGCKILQVPAKDLTSVG